MVDIAGIMVLTTETTEAPLFLCFIIALAAGAFICMGVAEDYLLRSVFYYVIGGILVILSTCLGMDDKEKIIYVGTIDETVSFREFHEHYELISRDGELFHFPELEKEDREDERED